MRTKKYPLYRGQEIIFTDNRNRERYGIIRNNFELVQLPGNYIIAIFEDTEGDSLAMSAFRCQPYID